MGTTLNKEKTLYPLFSAIDLNESLAENHHIHTNYIFFMFHETRFECV